MGVSENLRVVVRASAVGGCAAEGNGLKNRGYLPTVLPMIAVFLLFTAASSSSQAPGIRFGLKPWRGEGKCWKASDLNLSQEQLRGLDALQQAFFRETQAFRAQIFAKRLELRELLTNPGTRIETIRLKFSEILEQQSRIEEKSIDYLVRVRGLLTPEQLKNWCPEFEFPAFRRMMLGPDLAEPLPPRRQPPAEVPRPE